MTEQKHITNFIAIAVAGELHIRVEAGEFTGWFKVSDEVMASIRADARRDLIQALRPFAKIPPADVATDAHYWCVIGSPGKSHFTREDLERARDVMERIAP